jgi:hypothetical protein
MSDDSISTKGASITVKGSGSDVLPPVQLVVRGAAFHYQDYLTPLQARELGQRLIAVAAATEECEPSPSFDEVVDREMAKLKFVEVATPEAVTT